jgi:hypothetical protein
MKHSRKIVSDLISLNVSLFKRFDVRRILREHAACIELHAYLSILLTHLHTHSCIVVVQVLAVDALLQRLVLTARVGKRAVRIIV